MSFQVDGESLRGSFQLRRYSSRYDDEPQNSFFSSVITVVKCTVGAGLLTLPHAVSKLGLAFGLSMMIIFALLSISSMLLLKHCFFETDEPTYAMVAKKYYGYYLSKFVELSQLFYSFTTCCAYMVIIANQLTNVISFIDTRYPFPDSIYFLKDRKLLVTGCALIFILTPCYMKDFDSLKYTSTFGVICLLYITIITSYLTPWKEPCKLALESSYSCLHHMCYIDQGGGYSSFSDCQSHCQDTPDLMLSYIIFSIEMFSSISLFCYCFCCQLEFIPIISNMKGLSYNSVIKMMSVGFLIVILLYFPNSIAGYISFCNQTLGDELDSYDVSNIYIFIARIAIIIVLCFTIPFYVHTISHTVIYMSWESHHPPRRIYGYLIPTFTLIISIVISYFIYDLENILYISGSLAGCSLMITVPGLLYYKSLRTYKQQGCDIYLLYSILFIIIGILCTLLGFVSTIITIITHEV